VRGLRVIERLLYLAITDGEDVNDVLALGSGAITTVTSVKVRSSRKFTDLDFW
jgi:hypothetical protein